MVTSCFMLFFHFSQLWEFTLGAIQKFPAGNEVLDDVVPHVAGVHLAVAALLESAHNLHLLLGMGSLPVQQLVLHGRK